MGTEDTQSTPAEGGAAPAEAEPAPVVEAPAEGAPPSEAETPVVEKTPEEQAAEAEAAKAAEAKFLEELPALIEKIPESERRRLGQKYANGTMAAARRAERAAQTIAAENISLKAQLAEKSSGPSLRDDPSGALAAGGFKTVKEFIDHFLSKGEGKKPDPLDEVAKLRAERDAEKAERLAAEQRATAEASKQAVAEAIKAKPERWARTATSTGQSRLWGEIEAYYQAHHECPNEAVFYLADQVERELRAEFGEPARPAAKGTAAPAQGAPGTRTSAKAATITSKGTSAPVVREYSLDPDEARAQVLADMRAAGELRAAAE